jgi:predicted CopG family antitoxin
MANTPLRSFRIADDVYKAAQVRAEAEGTSVSAVVVELLKYYGQPNG